MEFKSVLTTCPYCGVGCNMLLESADGKLLRTRPAKEHPVSQGSLCIKGWNAHSFVQHEDRLTDPLKKEDGEFKKVEWDTALDEVAGKLKAIADEHGPESIAFLASARCTNEENYLLMKMARGVLNTPHVDHCARL